MSQGEYDVAACEPHKSISSCVDIQQRTVKFPTSGHIVFAEGHQHVGSYGIKIGREVRPIPSISRPVRSRGAARVKVTESLIPFPEWPHHLRRAAYFRTRRCLGGW